MRLQAKNTTQRGQGPSRIIIQGRIICAKIGSEVLFIKECIPSVIYLEGGFKKAPPVHKCHPAIVHIYTKAQSRATEVGSSIGSS
jgi:hypothetical protein